MIFTRENVSDFVSQHPGIYGASGYLSTNKHKIKELTNFAEAAKISLFGFGEDFLTLGDKISKAPENLQIDLKIREYKYKKQVGGYVIPFQEHMANSKIPMLKRPTYVECEFTMGKRYAVMSKDDKLDLTAKEHTLVALEDKRNALLQFNLNANLLILTQLARSTNPSTSGHNAGKFKKYDLGQGSNTLGFVTYEELICIIKKMINVYKDVNSATGRFKDNLVLVMPGIFKDVVETLTYRYTSDSMNRFSLFGSTLDSLSGVRIIYVDEMEHTPIGDKHAHNIFLIDTSQIISKSGIILEEINETLGARQWGLWYASNTHIKSENAIVRAVVSNSFCV